MSRFGFRSLLFMLLIAFLVWPSIFDICNARRGRHWRNRRPLTSSLYKKKGKSYHWSNHHNGGKPKAKAPERKAPPSQAPPIVSFPPPPTQKGSGTKIPAVFNVLDFGAQGDGTTDDTKAFETAWAAACKVEASTIVVPSSYQFLVGPVSFSGPNCQENIVFQLDGRIIAPISAKAWESAPMWWIEFTKLSGITVQGNGSMDGSGSVWWQDSAPYGTPVDDETQLIVPLNETMQQAPSKRERSQLSKNMPSIKPTALRFYGSFNVTVTGITIQNSPQCHLKFDTCTGVTVYQMNISSPGDSPNTDGIHLQNSRDVNIHSTNLSCGDDCVSIQTGCSNIYVHSLNCGPGHGISIGSLGRDNTRACVSNVTVRDITMQNTMTGVRIKTWQTCSHLVGLVRRVGALDQELTIKDWATTGLQASLEAERRKTTAFSLKIERLLKEKNEIKAENDSLKSEVDSMKVEIQRVDSLKSEVETLKEKLKEAKQVKEAVREEAFNIGMKLGFEDLEDYFTKKFSDLPTSKIEFSKLPCYPRSRRDETDTSPEEGSDGSGDPVPDPSTLMKSRPDGEGGDQTAPVNIN